MQPMSTQPSPARFIVPAVAFTLAAIVLGVVFTSGGGRGPETPGAADTPSPAVETAVDGDASDGVGQIPAAA